MCANKVRIQRVIGNVISCSLDLVLLHFLFIPFKKVRQYLLVQVTEDHLELGFLKVLLELKLACEVRYFCFDEVINVLEEEST